ncbi:MAG: thiamine diphosphokinase [Mangrovicoccus sp.]|nr:thiamine diphosphokinase [Mangrovicoccus sp.]
MSHRAPVAPVLHSLDPVLLIGAGPLDPGALRTMHQNGQKIVAADGGAAHVIAAGLRPDAVIGDMDSLDPALSGRLPAKILHPIAEQDSTDFEKCLSRIAAPLVLAMGFASGRMDHLLAVFNGMIRHPDRRCVLIGSEDLAVVLPPRMDLELPVGTALSLFPMARCEMRGAGLQYPLDGLVFEPQGQIGTSNCVIGPVDLKVDGPGMLLILPKAHLQPLCEGLARAPAW